MLAIGDHDDPALHPLGAAHLDDAQHLVSLDDDVKNRPHAIPSLDSIERSVTTHDAAFEPLVEIEKLAATIGRELQQVTRLDGHAFEESDHPSTTSNR